MFLEHNNEMGEENDYQINKFQTLDEKLKLISPAKYVNKGFSGKIRQQLEQISDYDNKIKDLLLKKTTEFIKKNKVLMEINKRSQIELKILKSSMRSAQKSVEHEKVKYNTLQLENKDLSLNLQYINEVIKRNDFDHSEELPRKKRKLLKENNNSNRTCSTVESLSII